VILKKIGNYLLNRPLYIGRVEDVPSNTLTTIVTAAADVVKYLTKITCSGEENARWELYINSVLIETKRTTDRNVEFEWNIPLKILDTEGITVKAIHYGPGTNATLNATVFGFPQ